MPITYAIPSAQECAKSHERWALAGFPVDESAPERNVNPYHVALEMIAGVRASLDALQAEIEELRSHQHQWGENDYCLMCGADGAA